jgi:hypothetical protein
MAGGRVLNGEAVSCAGRIEMVVTKTTMLETVVWYDKSIVAFVDRGTC